MSKLTAVVTETTYTLTLTEAEVRALRALFYRHMTNAAIVKVGLSDVDRALNGVTPAHTGLLAHSQLGRPGVLY